MIIVERILKNRESSQRYYKKNKAVIKVKSQARYKKNRVKILAEVKRYSQEHPEVRKEWVSRNREKLRTASRKYYQTDKGKKKAHDYYMKHRDKISAQKKKEYQEKKLIGKRL